MSAKFSVALIPSFPTRKVGFHLLHNSGAVVHSILDVSRSHKQRPPRQSLPPREIDESSAGESEDEDFQDHRQSSKPKKRIRKSGEATEGSADRPKSQRKRKRRAQAGSVDAEQGPEQGIHPPPTVSGFRRWGSLRCSKQQSHGLVPKLRPSSNPKRATGERRKRMKRSLILLLMTKWLAYGRQCYKPLMQMSPQTRISCPPPINSSCCRTPWKLFESVLLISISTSHHCN